MVCPCGWESNINLMQHRHSSIASQIIHVVRHATPHVYSNHRCHSQSRRLRFYNYDRSAWLHLQHCIVYTHPDCMPNALWCISHLLTCVGFAGHLYDIYTTCLCVIEVWVFNRFPAPAMVHWLTSYPCSHLGVCVLCSELCYHCSNIALLCTRDLCCLVCRWFKEQLCAIIHSVSRDTGMCVHPTLCCDKYLETSS